MHLDIRRTLGSSLIEEIYPSYVEAWESLLPSVAARHVLSFEEFAGEMVDPRIAKMLVLDDDRHVLAMTTVVTEIEAILWTNAEFYHRRYADEIARGAFFYVGYCVVHRPARGTRAIHLMVAELDRRLRQCQGVIGMDMSEYVINRGFGRRLMHIFKPERTERLDAQVYLVADYRPTEPTTTPSVPVVEDFEVVTLAERPELIASVAELLNARWPTFMLVGHPGHDVDIAALLDLYPDHQVILVDSHGVVRGIGLSLPLHWDGTEADLPDGWDDAVRRSAALAADGRRPTCASALSITVSPELGGRGLGARLISGLIGAAREAGFDSLIVPVRPTRKAVYPLTSMADYARWTTAEGATFDPWLRTHLDAGAELLAIAPASIVITGTVAEWQSWLGQALPVSGPYVIEDGLVPLEVDVDADLGRYREPCVWVRHHVV